MSKYDMHDVAKDINEDAQALAINGTIIVTIGGLIAVALGLGIGYWICPILREEEPGHIAKVCTDGRFRQLPIPRQSDDERGDRSDGYWVQCHVGLYYDGPREGRR